MCCKILHVLFLCFVVKYVTCFPGGWNNIPLYSPNSTISVHEAAEYIGGQYPSPVLAEKWLEFQPNFDIYKVKFNSHFRDGIDYNCMSLKKAKKTVHYKRRICETDVLWTIKPSKKTTFNIKCNPPWSSSLLPQAVLKTIEEEK